MPRKVCLLFLLMHDKINYHHGIGGENLYKPAQSWELHSSKFIACDRQKIPAGTVRKPDIPVTVSSFGKRLRPVL